MSNPNSVKLYNYLKALVCFDHSTVTAISKNIHGLTPLWLKQTRDGSIDIPSLLKAIAPVVKVPLSHLLEVSHGSNRPVERLIDKARHKIHDRQSLKVFLTVIAYTKGTTLSKMSLAMGNSTGYLNGLISHGTHERMEEKLTKLADQFDLSDIAMENAIDRSNTRHRKFAGGYFSGNTHSPRWDKAIKKLIAHLKATPLEHPEQMESVYQGMIDRKPKAVAKGLALSAVLKRQSKDDLKREFDTCGMNDLVPTAFKILDKFKQNAEGFKVVESAQFSSRLAEVRQNTPAFYTEPLINSLRYFNNAFQIHDDCDGMKITGFVMETSENMKPYQARDWADRVYPVEKPDNEPFITPAKYKHDRQSLLDQLIHTPTADGYLVTRRRTNVSLGKHKEAVIYLDDYLWRSPTTDEVRSVTQLMPLIRKKLSAKVRKLLSKFGN